MNSKEAISLRTTKLFRYILKNSANFGLYLIGAASLGYLLYGSNFAELNIYLSFLNFPIFVGEVLFFVCTVLLIAKLAIKPEKPTVWHYCLLAYFLFILYKALSGYSEFGPLALRHAALFYYPLFAAFGYYFFNKDFFNDRKKIFIILILIFAIRFPGSYEYCLFTCFSLALLLISSLSAKKIRYFLFLLLIIFTPYRLFFDTSRTMLVGNMAAIIYLAAAAFIFIKIKRRNKISLFLLIVLALFVVLFKAADPNSLKSIIKLKELASLYNKYNNIILEKQATYKMRNIREVRLYNPNKPRMVCTGENEMELFSVNPGENESYNKKNVFGAKKTQEVYRKTSIKDHGIALQKETDAKVKKEPECIENKGWLSIVKRERPSVKGKKLNNQLQTSRSLPEESCEKGKVAADCTKQELQEQKGRPCTRSLEGAYNNSLFRIFVWRDMLEDFKSSPHFWGFEFGKPFRSKSLEILVWADEDWMRDGWVTAHNSYCSIIYRAGAVGIVLIISMVLLLIKMIKQSVRRRSVTGILLCGILINWMVAANFLVILELPYNAIFFWSLLGMTLAYLKYSRTGL